MTTYRTSATGRKFRCGSFTLIGPPDQGQDRHRYLRHRCKAYSCPDCGPRKLHKARRRIGEVAHDKKLTRLATLTLDPSKVPPGKPSVKYLRDSWRKMRVSLNRFLGKSVEFIAVVEFQKSGLAHLHVLVGAYLPQAWLSEAWQGVGGGKIVDIRYVDVHRVSAYLSKYLTKESLGQMPSGIRRFSCSQGIKLWETKSGNSGWWLCKLSIEELRGWAKQATEEAWQEHDQGLVTLTFFTAETLVIAESFRYRPPIRLNLASLESRCRTQSS